MGPGITLHDIDILEELGHVSMLRGEHSTGILQVESSNYRSKTDDILINKMDADFTWFKYYNAHGEKGNKRVLKGVMNTLFAGHVRHATRGKINEANAHPFEFSNIIGMHNGTLRDKKYNEDPDKTDSEMMFADMNERGIIPVLEELHEDSAYAIVVYDKRTGNVTFARNDRRPLAYAQHAQRGVVYWASEAAMLRFVLGRNNINLLENRTGGYWNFMPRTVLTIHPRRGIIPGKEVEWLFEKLKEPEKEEKKEEIKAVVHTQSNIVALPKPASPVIRKDYGPTKVKHVECIACQRDLNLVDQHYSTKYGYDTFVCQECHNGFVDLDNPAVAEKIVKAEENFNNVQVG